MYGGTESALLYNGKLLLVFTLIACIYGWLFAGLMNACNYALLEVLLRKPIIDERSRTKISSLLMRCIAAVITIAIVFCELEYMVQLEGARVFIMSAAVVATAAAVEIGKKGENMSWNLLAHHIAIIAIILYAFDRLIWASANYLREANSVEFATFLSSENIFAKLPKHARASVEMIIKYTQVQVLGTALELPTTLARLHDCVKKYAAKYEPIWQDYLPASRNMQLSSLGCWVLLKCIFVPVFTIYLLVDYADDARHIWFTYCLVAVSAMILWLASLWVCHHLWIRYHDEVNSAKLHTLASTNKHRTAFKAWSFTSNASAISGVSPSQASAISGVSPSQASRKQSVASTDLSEMDLEHLYAELELETTTLDDIYEENITTARTMKFSKKIWWGVKGFSYFTMSSVSIVILFYQLRL